MLSIAYICRVSNLINFYYETSVHLHFVRFYVLWRIRTKHYDFTPSCGC